MFLFHPCHGCFSSFFFAFICQFNRLCLYLAILLYAPRTSPLNPSTHQSFQHLVHFSTLASSISFSVHSSVSCHTWVVPVHSLLSSASSPVRVCTFTFICELLQLSQLAGSIHSSVSPSCRSSTFRPLQLAYLICLFIRDCHPSFLWRLLLEHSIFR